mmetsp:Transcript_67608/g.194271  ORF Transcript_67608/g.194271 Transcript_67608/m.194271 type:complete len:216 (+) Transcript_67608:266-913(+)
MRLPCRSSGTSPEAIIIAKPSAMAVLPTPGSPMRTGLFFWRRAKIWMVRSSSAARPMSGSIVPSSAALVKSVPYSSSVAVLPEAPPLELTPTKAFSSFSEISFESSSGIFEGSTFRICRSSVALPPSSFMSASKMCAVSMALEFSFRDSSTALLSTRLHAGVKGISTATMPLPLPTMSSTAFLTSFRVTPSFRRTFVAAPDVSETTPTSIISVPT